MRPFSVFVLAGLLIAGCSSEPVEPPVPVARPGPPADAPRSPVLHAITGSLLGIPAGADVELALLHVDDKRRPERLLGSLRLRGNGHELPFMLRFNTRIFDANQPVELRGRVSQGGQLILLLPARRIATGDNQSLGPLQLVPAP